MVAEIAVYLKAEHLFSGTDTVDAVHHEETPETRYNVLHVNLVRNLHFVILSGYLQASSISGLRLTDAALCSSASSTWNENDKSGQEHNNLFHNASLT